MFTGIEQVYTQHWPLLAIHVLVGIVLAAAIFATRKPQVIYLDSDDDLSPEEAEDVSRIREGLGLADEPIRGYVAEGASVYNELNDLNHAYWNTQAYAHVPVNSTYDPNRQTGVAFTAYAPVSHRMPENENQYPYRRLRGLVEDTQTFSLVDAV